MGTEANNQSDLADLSFGGSDGNVQEQPSPELQSAESPGNPFINEVAPDHRSIVKPYLDKWEKNATQKFQDYSSKLKPWNELGMPVDEVKRYIQAGNRLKNEPEEVFRIMWNSFQDQYGEDFETHLFRILGVMEEEGMSEEGYFEQEGGEPDQEEVWRSNLEKELTEMREWRSSLEQQAEEAEQEAQLDELLTNMHNQLGEFEDDIMLVMLSRYNDVPKAVKAYNEAMSKHSQRTSRQVPKTMGGQGGVPNGQVDTAKLRGEERRKAVQAVLEAGAQ